jgi:uncharacterized protein
VALLNSPLRVPRPQLFKYVEAVRNAPYINLIYIEPTIDSAAWELLKTREDKAWSLVDSTSFIVMQQLGIKEALNQFAIRNSQFAITFCDGDLDPDTKRAACRGRGLKPPKFVNHRSPL